MNIKVNDPGGLGIGGGHRVQQHGGIGSGWTMVGEQGPELLKLPPGSHVKSNPDTQHALAGGGGPTEVRLVVESGGSSMDDLLVEIIRKAVTVRGGDVQLALGRAS